MIAQLSQSAWRGRPFSSSIGVRWAGFFARNSGVVVFPQTSSSSNSRPAARTKMRAVRLLTLGFRTWSLCAAMSLSQSVGWTVAGRYGSRGERSSDSDGRERSTIASIASARCSMAML